MSGEEIHNLQFANRELKMYLCLMRKHNGMRPQDVVVLLKMITITETGWQFKDLAQSLALSPAEVSESLNRSHFAGLVDDTKRKVNRLSVVEFIRYGLHYVFPQAPGSFVNGVPTAHSHPYFEKKINSEFKYVWPLPEGKIRGLSIEPLYASLPRAAAMDEDLYLLLACTDILRVGKAREVKLAGEVLNKKILHELP
jgi:predicted transcriptional regulator